MTERVALSSLFEALGQVIREHKPELLNELNRLGVDVSALAKEYPITLWRDATTLVAQRLFPELSPPVAEYRLGQLVMRRFEKTLVGTTVVALLKIVGPSLSVGRVSRSFRAANNYTEDKTTKLGEGDYELWLNEVHVPYLDQGILQAALEMIGAKGCTVEVTRRDEQGTTYRVRWNAER